MKAFLFALQFLTIIPVKIKNMDENRLAASMMYFPVIGGLLGLIAAGAWQVTRDLGFPAVSSSIITIVLLIFLTGGIHLDGLADTADGILSRKSKEEMLNIMRDPHIATMGVLSIISAVLLKIAFLAAMDASLRTTAILLMCILSRWSCVFSVYLFPYARKEGKAGIFKAKMNLKVYLTVTFIALLLTAGLWKFQGLLTFGIVAASAFALGCFFKKHLGGITGDTLGAVSEISEIAVLLYFCVLK